MKTDLNIRPMTPQEKIYAGLQSSQISGQTGYIGMEALTSRIRTCP